MKDARSLLKETICRGTFCFSIFVALPLYGGTSTGYYRRFFREIPQDIIDLNKNLFSWDSLKIVAATAVPYAITYQFDKRIHHHFYCAPHHKNINQMPCWCNNFARYGLAVPIIGLGSCAFFSHDPQLQITGKIFLLGMPFLIFGNKITKKIRFEACYRPWHEEFSATRRSPGGFPSGHAAYVAYMTVLYGLQYGIKVALPLAAYSAFVCANFCMSNRHYLSQIIAGVGLGTLYAVAAHRLVDAKRAQNVTFGVSTDSNGRPALSLACKF